jgi:hypothetical protein
MATGLKVGSVSITKEEKSRLPFDTAQNALRNGEYVVGLQVFHQLHCLVRLPLLPLFSKNWLVCNPY